VSNLYDLILLLDSDAPSERRERILRDVESAIASGGTLESNYDWGIRRLAYQIDHRDEAEYHLLQFSGRPDLPDSLARALKLIDGIVRFRIIKVKPGTPPPPTVRSEGPGESPARAPEPAEARAPR
jgi:small subunit ribosomal protein S6